MKTVTNAMLSRNPIPVPADEDMDALKATREKLAREIESQEFLNKAKENPDFQRIVMDSYLSMQMIERAAMMLDPKKPDFALSFAGLQGRHRERQALTEEMMYGKMQARKKRNLLEQIGDKLKALQARLLLTKQM